MGGHPGAPKPKKGVSPSGKGPLPGGPNPPKPPIGPEAVKNPLGNPRETKG